MAKKIKNSEIPLTLKDIKRIAASKGVKMENLHLYNPKHSLFGPLKPNELELGRAAAALEKLNQKQGGKSTGNTTTRGSNSGGTVRTVTTTQREPKGGSKYVPVAGTSDSLKTSRGGSAYRPDASVTQREKSPKGNVSTSSVPSKSKGQKTRPVKRR